MYTQLTHTFRTLTHRGVGGLPFPTTAAPAPARPPRPAPPLTALAPARAPTAAAAAAAATSPHTLRPQHLHAHRLQPLVSSAPAFAGRAAAGQLLRFLHSTTMACTYARVCVPVHVHVFLSCFLFRRAQFPLRLSLNSYTHVQQCTHDTQFTITHLQACCVHTHTHTRTHTHSHTHTLTHTHTHTLCPCTYKHASLFIKRRATACCLVLC